ASAAERLMGLPEGSRVLVAFPVAPGGTPRDDLFDRLRKRGFGRLLVGESVVALEDAPDAVGADGTPLVVVVDRTVVREDARSRLADSLETAFAEGAGQALAQVVDGPRLAFSDRCEGARCAKSFLEPQPRLFSCHHPFGAPPASHDRR